MSSLVRRVLRLVSRNVVLKRHLPKEFAHAVIYVSPDAALQNWRLDAGNSDLELLDVVRRYVQPHMTVWDVGANIGLFTFPAAAKGAKVYSMEPDVFLISLLRKSQRANRLDVIPIPVAISDQCDLAEFHIAAQGRSANFIGQGMSDAGGTRWIEIVPCVTLDWLAEKLQVDPDFIKIDVEGGENLVLQGGFQLLQRKHPMLFCEVSPDPASRCKTTEILRSLGYRFFNVKNNTWVDSAVFSTLAVYGDLPSTQVSAKRAGTNLGH